jgi:hypothetical protein
LADPYDGAKPSSVQITDLINLISGFNNAGPLDFKIIETSITGNMPLEEMQSRRAVWHTVDDNKAGFQKSKISYELGDSITMEPQRIRVFMVEFSRDASAFIQ